MAKVYVSSTIADLKPERQAVLDWLRAARHQAVDSYLPDSETVRDSCLDDVGTCDLYVLILGHRYGFVPADDNPEGLSITRLEFRRAGECGIPRVALLRTSIPDERLSDLQDPARAALVWAFRAEVARTVRPAEFSDEGGLIQGLSTGVQAALARLDQRPGGRAASGRVLRLAPRPVFLAGREELLAELDARLTENGGGPRVAALCGLGGAGKTSVALEYAHRHLGEVGLAWQLSAEDPTVLAAAFGELATQLGAGDSGDPVVSVHGALAAHPMGWLLVFDNAPDRASVAASVPPAGRGRVLITSRDQIWPPGQALDVPVLDPQVAAQFLVDRTGDPDRQAALALAGELGGLPLALEQAGAYIQATAGSLAGYLGSFRQRRDDLLARGEPTGYDKTVATTWSLALRRLEESTPSAAGLLRLLACMAPEPVPLTLLLADAQVAGELAPEVAASVGLLLGDSVAAGDAVAALRRYSLVTPAGDGVVLVHRLVQAVTLAQPPTDVAAAWRQAAAALIEAALPDDAELPASWPAYAALVPHAQAALAVHSTGMGQVASYLGNSGSYVAARALCQQVLEARARILGREHPDTLTIRARLGWWTALAGDPAGARDQLAALLPVRERVSGPEHPDTLADRARLSWVTGLAGDPGGARDQFAALLPVRERVSGAEHPDTLSDRRGLAAWTGRAGDAARARDQLAALLPVRERVLGPDHQRILADWTELARWTGEAGDAAGARDQLAALLPAHERVAGPEHPDTLTVRGNLARWTGEAGDAAGARDQLAALLPARERVSGLEHPDTLADRADLARWTGKAGNAAGARDQYAALLPVIERVYGLEHPYTLTTRDNLTHCTSEASSGPGSGLK